MLQHGPGDPPGRSLPWVRALAAFPQIEPGKVPVRTVAALLDGVDARQPRLKRRRLPMPLLQTLLTIADAPTAR